MTALRLFESSVNAYGGLDVWQQPELELVAPVAERIVLVGCTKTKRATSAPAGDLYDPSDLYRRRRGYAIASGRRWAILSALYGLVTPDRELDPYDYSIDDRRREGAGRCWAIGVIQAAHRLAGIETELVAGTRRYSRPLVLEVHAGRPYVELLEVGAALFAGVTIEHPVRGLGIGQQKRHYADAAA